ncbi:MAG: hypothetical protein U5L45_22655 [Saprospiraceae bacterium]|nr:hypothetical protein [Saprospiraceae bacterium]
MKSFETWNYEEVEHAFGISPVDSLPKYEDWLKADNCEPNEIEAITLEHYRKLLLKEAKNWNEDELKLFFIGSVLALVDFNTPNFQFY